MGTILQLSFDLPEAADERLEQLLADELAREAGDPAYGLLLIELEAPPDAA